MVSFKRHLAKFNDAASHKAVPQPTEPHTRAISITYWKDCYCLRVQGPPLAQAFFARIMRTWVQANFMLHVVARWRAPNARNFNECLLPIRMSIIVDAPCPVVCLSTTALPVLEGFALPEGRASGHTIKSSRQLDTVYR